MPCWTRRVVAAALPSLALVGRAQASGDASVEGLTTYSESAMVMSVSADGRSALTLRFCRFPQVDATWLWCHVVRDGTLYAFAQHDLPSSSERLADGADANYRVPGRDADLVRAGKGAGLKRVSLSATLGFHESRAAPLGPGPVKGHLSGLFSPTHALTAAVLKDRDEVYGTFEGEVAVAGRRWAHRGPAKFHEQRQTAPRFETPFCYSWLGGDRLAATTLLIPQGATGGWVFGDNEEALAGMAVQPPGDLRAVDYRLRSGQRLRGELSAIVRYEIPIHGRPWQGSFVRGLVDGKPVVGVMNDWPGPPDIYVASAEIQRLSHS